jgi:hypothetical protein
MENTSVILAVPNDTMGTGNLQTVTVALLLGYIQVVLFSLNDNYITRTYFSSPFLKSFIDCMRAADGLFALLLGFAVYINSYILIAAAILGLNKIGNHAVLQRTVTGKNHSDEFHRQRLIFETYWHHAASHFVCHPCSLVGVSVWRFISMSIHGAYALKRLGYPHYCDPIVRALYWPRILSLCWVSYALLLQPKASQALLVNIVGHSVYLLIRCKARYEILYGERGGTGGGDAVPRSWHVFELCFSFLVLAEMWVVFMTRSFFVELEHLGGQVCSGDLAVAINNERFFGQCV